MPGSQTHSFHYCCPYWRGGWRSNKLTSLWFNQELHLDLLQIIAAHTKILIMAESLPTLLTQWNIKIIYLSTSHMKSFHLSIKGWKCCHCNSCFISQHLFNQVTPDWILFILSNYFTLKVRSAMEGDDYRKKISFTIELCLVLPSLFCHYHLIL